jgi:hypothetical protein
MRQVAPFVLVLLLSVTPAAAQEAPAPHHDGREDDACRDGCIGIGVTPGDTPELEAPGGHGCLPGGGSDERGGCPGANGGGAAAAPSGAAAAASGDAAAPPPVPPRVDEVPCPAIDPPAIGRDPRYAGLTGLDTYLWASPQSAQTTTGNVRGYATTCTVTPVEWTWTTGDGGTYTRTRHGGPHPDNPVTHLYRRKDLYELTLTVRWQLRTNFGALSTVTRTHREPYRVYEVVSEPRP